MEIFIIFCKLKKGEFDFASSGNKPWNRGLYRLEMFPWKSGSNPRSPCNPSGIQCISNISKQFQLYKP